MAIPKLRVVPPWTRNFLQHIRDGRSEKVAANLAQVGTAEIHRLKAKDDRFLADYQTAFDARKAPVRGG